MIKTVEISPRLRVNASVNFVSNVYVLTENQNGTVSRTKPIFSVRVVGNFSTTGVRNVGNQSVKNTANTGMADSFVGFVLKPNFSMLK